MGQSPGSCHFPLLSQVRAPSLHRHYPASAVLRTHPPSAPTDAIPRGFVLGPPGAARGRRGRLPLLRTRPCPRVLPSLPRRNPRVRFSLASPGAAAFPVIGAGRLPPWPFPGLLGVSSGCRPWPPRQTSLVAHQTLPSRAAILTPAEPPGAFLARFPGSSGLPRYWGGSASALAVSGPARCSLTLRPARSADPLQGLFSECFRPFVASWSAPSASGWSESLPAGYRSRGSGAPFQGTPNDAAGTLRKNAITLAEEIARTQAQEIRNDMDAAFMTARALRDLTASLQATGATSQRGS